MTDNNNLKGLSGWLILVGIGVVVGPIRLSWTLLQTYAPLAEEGLWEALTTPGSPAYTPNFEYLLLGELAVNLLILLASIYLIYLFFRRHRWFPKVFIGIAAVTLIFIPLDAWVVSQMIPDTPMFDEQTTREFSRSLVYALIWVPYMIMSERVRLTFVGPETPNNEFEIESV